MAGVIGPFEWGVASTAREGQNESGDSYLIKPFRIGPTEPGTSQGLDGLLVAVVDGLGHGEEAAKASGYAISALEAAPADPLLALVKRCHRTLYRTRGVVMSLASFSLGERRIEWLGVGNVEGLLLRRLDGELPEIESLLLRGGVVGGEMPKLFPSQIALMPGDTLIFATDGIASDFVRRMSFHGAPQQCADRILARFGKSSDDALVLVVRYLGPG